MKTMIKMASASQANLKGRTYNSSICKEILSLEKDVVNQVMKNKQGKVQKLLRFVKYLQEFWVSNTLF